MQHLHVSPGHWRHCTRSDQHDQLPVLGGGRETLHELLAGPAHGRGLSAEEVGQVGVDLEVPGLPAEEEPHRGRVHGPAEEGHLPLPQRLADLRRGEVGALPGDGLRHVETGVRLLDEVIPGAARNDDAVGVVKLGHLLVYLVAAAHQEDLHLVPAQLVLELLLELLEQPRADVVVQRVPVDPLVGLEGPDGHEGVVLDRDPGHAHPQRGAELLLVVPGGLLERRAVAPRGEPACQHSVASAFETLLRLVEHLHVACVAQAEGAAGHEHGRLLLVEIRGF
mmetsp:Transcript_671/g.2126  ORF Transcript_671/g.2126 Transcript_671/m.2126 type:complete len:280 (+) Transcript_671:994-1833(+)